MNFGLSEEQDMLRTTAKDFISKECPKRKVRELEEDPTGYDPAMWQKMAELGWLGLMLPEKYGGIDASVLDLAILMEEMGRGLLPGPFFSTIVCTLPVLRYGTDEQREELLPRVAKGEAIWSLALTESTGSYEASGIRVRGWPSDDGFAIEGEKSFVSYANVADCFLVAARTSEQAQWEDGITVFIVNAQEPGIEIEVVPTMARDQQCRVRFRTRARNTDILAVVNRGWEILDFTLQRAAVTKSAEMVGASQAVLDMTSTYARERIQFDRAIGSFQVIQHKLVDMLIDIEAVQYLVYQAAWELSVGTPSRLHISIAKAKANEVYQRTCLEGIKIHGAVGFTLDHDIGLYYRRVKSAEVAGGDTMFHKKRIAAEF